jgi:hypothetical protein
VSIDNRPFTVPYLFEACRSLCAESERETKAFISKRSATQRSAGALSTPIVAVAGVAAFLDQYGAAFIMLNPEAQATLRRSQQPGGPSLPRLYAECHKSWFGSDVDSGLLSNLRLLYDVRTVLTHPHRRPTSSMLRSLSDRALLLGPANWPSHSQRDEFPVDLMWDEFAIWCFDVAADAARTMVRQWDDTEAGRWFAQPFRPYRGTYVLKHPIKGSVARTGLASDDATT